MNFSNYSHVHILRSSSAEEMYLLSSGSVPSTVVILTNHLVTNCIKAFKAVITDEVVADWNLDALNSEMSRPLFIEEIGKALVGNDGFTFELTYRFKVPKKLVLANLLDTNNPKTILEADLEEIPASEGIIAMSRTATNASKIGLMTDDDKAEIKSLQKENAVLKRLLDDLTVAKSRWEDCHYRAFTKIINAKKRRICELEGVEFGKKNSHNRPQTNSSDDSAEENTSDSDGNSSDDYGNDTDVDSPGFGRRTDPGSVRRSNREAKTVDTKDRIAPRLKIKKRCSDDSETGSEFDCEEKPNVEVEGMGSTRSERVVKSKISAGPITSSEVKTPPQILPKEVTVENIKGNTRSLNSGNTNGAQIPSTSKYSPKPKDTKTAAKTLTKKPTTAPLQVASEGKRARVPVKKGAFVMDDTDSDAKGSDSEIKIPAKIDPSRDSNEEKAKKLSDTPATQSVLSSQKTRASNLKNLFSLDSDDSDAEIKESTVSNEAARKSNDNSIPSSSVASKDDSKKQMKKSPASSDTGDEMDF